MSEKKVFIVPYIGEQIIAPKIDKPFGIIYLATNLTNEKQYAGKTTHTLEYRWQQHICDSRGKGKGKDLPIHRAISKYGDENFKKEELECEINCEDELNMAETLAICLWKTISPFGYNLTYGGEGGQKSDETKAKIKAILATPEVHTRMVDAIHITQARPGYQMRRGAALRIALNLPETKAKRSRAQKRVHNTPEAKELTSINMLELHSQPAFKEKHRQSVRDAWKNPEIRKNMLAAITEAQNRPEVKAKISAALKAACQRPEVKARKSAAAKAYCAKKKAEKEKAGT